MEVTSLDLPVSIKKYNRAVHRSQLSNEIAEVDERVFKTAEADERVFRTAEVDERVFRTVGGGVR